MKLREFISFAGKILFNPEKATKEILTIKELFLYLLTISLVASIVGGIFLSIPFQVETKTITIGQILFGLVFDFIIPTRIPRYLFDIILKALSFPFSIPLLFIFLLIRSFLRIIILGSGTHLIGKITKSFKKEFTYTFRSNAYAETPAILFGWLPIIGQLADFWVLIILIKSISNQHQVSIKKAFSVFIIAAILIIILINFIFYISFKTVFLAIFPAFDSDFALNEFALERNNAAPCWNIDFRNADSCFQEIAINLKDTSLCNNMLDNQVYCRTIIKALTNKDASLCKELEKTYKLGTFVQRCYLTVATSMMDTSICDLIEDMPFNRDIIILCHNTVKTKLAIENNNPSLCEELNIMSPHDRDKEKNDCYFSVAKAKKDTSLCEKITSNDYRIYCRAILTTDSTLCKNINEMWYAFPSRNVCYEEIAKITLDASLCENMYRDEYKQECLMEINLRK